MRQSASTTNTITHSYIPVRTTNTTPGKDAASTLRAPNLRSPEPSPSSSLRQRHEQGVSSSKWKFMERNGLGISVSMSPSRVPVRASNNPSRNGLSSTGPSTRSDSTATDHPYNKQTINSGNNTVAQIPRPQPSSILSEPFQTRVYPPRQVEQTPSPTFSSSLSPSFIVRNLDEDPHTGLTPTTQAFGPRKFPRTSTTLQKTLQLPSPPSSPDYVEPPSRIPRRSKDDLSLTESARKLQAASAKLTTKPRRISIPTTSPEDLASLQIYHQQQNETMTVALQPPAPITIPPNDSFGPFADKSLAPPPNAKPTTATISSFFRWKSTDSASSNGTQGITSPHTSPHEQLRTPSSTYTHPISPLTPTSPSINALEQELRAVSADLAYSIRREMDLEDVITRLQDEVIRLGGESKRDMRFRTSDYFSEVSVQGSPPLKPSDSHPGNGGKRSHSRVSSVAVEDIRMANEKVTQLEKEILVLKHENLELMTARRDVERKLREQRRSSKDARKIAELEGLLDNLRLEVDEKNEMIEKLQKTVEMHKDEKVNVEKVQKNEQEMQQLMERAKGAESQREALQLALRQLRERQTLEAKKASDRIKQLETERTTNATQRRLPRTPERAVTGIVPPTPESAKRVSPRAVETLEQKLNQFKRDLSQANKEITHLTMNNTQLKSENENLRGIQQKLQSRLTHMEAAASASSIGEASAAASLSYANRLALEMARVTDIHVKSLEKVRNTANASLPHFKNGMPLSPMLQGAYDMSLGSPKKSSDETTVRMMEERIKELESALKESSEEMGEVVKKMQLAQIEMIELAGERDEALRRERKLLHTENHNRASDGSGEMKNLQLPPA